MVIGIIASVVGLFLWVSGTAARWSYNAQRRRDLAPPVVHVQHTYPQGFIYSIQNVPHNTGVQYLNQQNSLGYSGAQFIGDQSQPAVR